VHLADYLDRIVADPVVSIIGQFLQVRYHRAVPELDQSRSGLGTDCNIEHERQQMPGSTRRPYLSKRVDRRPADTGVFMLKERQ